MMAENRQFYDPTAVKSLSGTHLSSDPWGWEGVETAPQQVRFESHPPKKEFQSRLNGRLNRKK